MNRKLKPTPTYIVLAPLALLIAYIVIRQPDFTSPPCGTTTYQFCTPHE